MGELQKAFAADLNRLRGYGGLSISEVAKESGVPAASVGDLLRGGWKRVPPWDRVSAVVDACVRNLPSEVSPTVAEELRRLGSLGWWREQHADLVRRVELAPRPGRAVADASAAAPSGKTRRSAGAGPPPASTVVGSPALGHIHGPGLNPVIGREAALADLHARFATDRVQVLAGMGGVGKTSLARTYAQRHRDDYQLVWWIRAEDPAAVDIEFRLLLDVLLPPGDAAKIIDARTKVFALLAQRDDRWLLVLDNVPDPASVNGLLPGGNGHVLITSRSTTWPVQSIVEPLDADAAVELLVSGTGDDDRVVAEALAEELGGLPLALSQAAAYTRATQATLASYLRWYRDKSDVLLEQGRPADYPDTVATTWELAMDRLSDNAKALLNLIAFVASDAIPVHLLLATTRLPIADEFTRHKAIGELCAYSLITPGPSDTITTHRLIQLVTRNRLSNKEVWSLTAATMINAATPDWPATTPITTWRLVHTHLHAVLNRLPAEHPVTLATRFQLAHGVNEMGDRLQARDLLAELTPVFERVLGSEHPATINVRHSLAHCTGEAGDAAQARDMFADLLAVRERVQGPEHLDTLRTRSNLVRRTGDAGDHARARDQATELVATCERALGADHPDTLVARHRLAQHTSRAGDAAGARDQAAELLEKLDRLMGAEHHETLSLRHSLACFIGEAGDPARARDMLTELLPICERVQGTEHPDTLIIRYSLASVTGKSGNPAKARDILADLLPICESVLGDEHPHTVVIRLQFLHWFLASQK